MEIGHNKPATKLVEVRLSALTRMEYMEVVEVPANITDEELTKLIDERYEQVDGGGFSADPEYWERGSCYAVDSDMTDATPSLVALRSEHGLKTAPVESTQLAPDEPKNAVHWLSAAEFAKTHSCSPEFVEAVGPKLVPVLPQGMTGTTSGYVATVLRHYSDGMYEVRVPGGEKCISWQDIEFAGKLQENDDPDYWYHNRHQLQPEQIFRLHDGNIVKLDGRVPGDGTKWYVAEWNNGWTYSNVEIEPGDLRGTPMGCLPVKVQ